jgi:group I intron endonuclease
MNKNELKRQYKQTLREMGVFQIRNKANGKILIGSAKDLNGKINSNKFQLKTGRHYNQALQKDYNQYGENNFSFEVLDYLKPTENQKDYSDELKLLEEMWLNKLKPYEDKGYHSGPISR